MKVVDLPYIFASHNSEISHKFNVLQIWHDACFCNIVNNMTNTTNLSGERFMIKGLLRQTWTHQILSVGALALLSGVAHAGVIYQYEASGDIPQGSNAGDVSAIVASYNSDTEQFTWSYTITDNEQDKRGDSRYF